MRRQRTPEDVRPQVNELLLTVDRVERTETINSARDPNIGEPPRCVEAREVVSVELDLGYRDSSCCASCNSCNGEDKR